MAFNPKNRKLDKRGNPIVTKEELEASGMSLRDFLNKERGLTRRGGSKPDVTAPMQGPAVKANPMADQKDTDKRVMMGEARKRAAAPITKAEMADDERKTYKPDPRFAGEAEARATASDGGMEAAQEAREYDKRQRAAKMESRYGGGLKKGGVVKEYKSGGSVARGGGAATRGTKFKGVC